MLFTSVFVRRLGCYFPTLLSTVHNTCNTWRDYSCNARGSLPFLEIPNTGANIKMLALEIMYALYPGDCVCLILGLTYVVAFTFIFLEDKCVEQGLHSVTHLAFS